MTQLLLIGGAWNFDPFALQRELGARPEFAVVRFEPASMFTRLREATAHRASVWQGVNARPSDWIEPAVQRFGAELEAALFARARATSGREAPFVVCSHASNAIEIERLSLLFPNARFVHTVRDGAVAHLARAGNQPPPSPSFDGFAWALDWSRVVAAPARAAKSLGERLITLRAEDVDRDRDAAIASLMDALGADGPRRWLGAWPASEPRLAGEALETFYAHPGALRMLAHFGYESRAAKLDFELPPHVAALVAREWIDADRDAEAESLIRRTLARSGKGPGSSAVHEALGLFHRKAGREDDAVRSFLRAIQLGGAAKDAWIGLLSMPHRSESCVVADAARFQSEVSVRAALARWLVARGLDAEAAEIVANVEHQAWQS